MNTYFQFKQFIINQDKCAMKVCTDACLFGAYIANKLSNKEIVAESILDIGCGTGLLSLMLSQKSNATIDAVEINENAFLQAKENVGISAWQDKIKVFHQNIIDLNPTKKYDLIICNPPFFDNQLKSGEADRNSAMHSTTLTFFALALAIKKHLAIHGKATLLIPFDRVNTITKILEEQGLYINIQLNINHSSTHKYFRCVITITTTKTNNNEETLSIKDITNNYTNEFKILMKDYYLQL